MFETWMAMRITHSKRQLHGGSHGNLFNGLKHICHVCNDPNMTINYTCHKSKWPQFDYHNIYIQMLYSQSEYSMII